MEKVYVLTKYSELLEDTTIVKIFNDQGEAVKCLQNLDAPFYDILEIREYEVL